MKTNLCLTLILQLGLLTSRAQVTLAPPSQGKSVVYFVRPSSMGVLINFSYFDREKLIGRFNGVKYIRYECEPGKHLFWARSENRDFIQAELAPDKIYFIEAVPQMGAIKAGVRLVAVAPHDQKAMKRIFKLLNKKPSESFSEEQLSYDSAELSDAVSRGIKKYLADSAQKRNFQRLGKDSFYEGAAHH